MKLWFGGKSRSYSNLRNVANDMTSITKLMGEAFKLHSQALIGYEDAMSSRSGSPTPSIAAQPVRVLPEMQTAY